MALETATYISDLNISNPAPGDVISQGDDHIRMAKSVLKNTFPGAAGQGFASPIAATEAELNRVQGVTSPIQTQLNVLAAVIPSGTKMPFYQASPPSGWTSTAIQNDSMMRVVTAAGTGGTSGAGSGHSPILNNVVTSHTHVFTGDPLAAHTHTDSGHTHTIIADIGAGGDGFVGASNQNRGNKTTASGNASISSNSAGTPSGTNAVPAGAANWQPRYMDFCVGTKT
jgi:hypothetical protein